MRSIYLVLAMVVIVGGLAIACEEKPAGPFVQVAAFEGGADDRIFAVGYAPGTPQEEMRMYAKRARNTSGRVTAVYFYPRGVEIPARHLAAAQSLDEAYRVLGDPASYTFVFVRERDGLEHFASCFWSRQDVLCMK